MIRRVCGHVNLCNQLKQWIGEAAYIELHLLILLLQFGTSIVWRSIIRRWQTCDVLQKCSVAAECFRYPHATLERLCCAAQVFKDPQFIDSLLEHIRPQLSTLKPNELTGCLWALKTAHHTPADDWLSEMYEQTEVTICQLRPDEVAVMLRGLAGLQVGCQTPLKDCGISLFDGRPGAELKLLSIRALTLEHHLHICSWLSIVTVTRRLNCSTHIMDQSCQWIYSGESVWYICYTSLA